MRLPISDQQQSWSYRAPRYATSEIWRLTGRKTPIFLTPLLFNALARGEPFRISA